MGSAGYVLCLLFYSPLVVSNSYMLEPFIAQLLGYAIGLDKFPGIFTFIGAIITLYGIN